VVLWSEPSLGVFAAEGALGHVAAEHAVEGTASRKPAGPAGLGEGAG
jgi:hypothetical protein